MTEFGRLDPDGSYTHLRTIPQSAMLACPHFIMVPEHYREDNSCRCDDRTHEEMAEWGYVWNEDVGRWLGDDEPSEDEQAEERYLKSIEPREGRGDE